VPWSPRLWFAQAVYRDRIWILGGWLPEPGNYNDIWFTEDGKQWTEVKCEKIWKQRHQPAVYVFDDKIWIAGGHLEHELRLQERLTEHLRQGDAEVRRVELDDLEPLRQAGDIPHATIVVILDLALDEDTRPEWTSRPEYVCGPAGCYTTTRSVVYQMPVVRAELEVTVYDGPTARVQQRVTLRSTDEGGDWQRMRQEVVRDLIGRLTRMVDQRREQVEVELFEVDVPAVRRAVEAIEGGDWTRGRGLLERAWHSDEVRALPEEERARVLYDLGQARRFDPSTLDQPEQHFAAAERALRAAVRLDGHPQYERALSDLSSHRRQLALLRAQREAAAHNFRIGRPPPADVPDPPASYREP